MIQLTHIREHVEDEVVARITGAMHPWRIVLFGSRARGSSRGDSDYDFFVEVDAERDDLRKIDRQIRDLFSDWGLLVDLKVACRGDLERRRDDPGTIEWGVAREGKLLYADPRAPRELAPPSDRIREPSPGLPESVAEWLETAEQDLKHCRLLRQQEGPDDWSPQICGLSQQAAEKFMKALLVARRIRPERTHGLGEHLEALRASGCALEGLDADCALLTTHAITPRYPAGLNLGEEDARTAFAALERIVASVRARLPRRLH